MLIFLFPPKTKKLKTMRFCLLEKLKRANAVPTLIASDEKMLSHRIPKIK
jgi:hypothetical protein